jgi:hypothetical protein
MSVNFLHTKAPGRNEPTAPPGAASPPRPGRCGIDWQAARQANRSCCCPARPAVIAVMPTAPGRPHQTDLLLCWHHYQASRQGLASAGATIITMDGTPVGDDTWPPAS